MDVRLQEEAGELYMIPEQQLGWLVQRGGG